ncbi:glycosyltransferase [Streptomyces oryzae]|uniref:Glycosyltransferase n=1 Tax=Streptomyces oryzae TaxID=1434886 RepID=A0ABS3XMK0_9ACTN|nr:glycosyltransferase [Streptomyces oryzae]MBO8196635.1 glycosyltransferase [Streptomyces oryzae]
MSTNVVFPSGVRSSGAQPSVAWDEWARHGFGPLEVVVETVDRGGRLIRLAGPARCSWIDRCGRFVPVSSEWVANLTAQMMRSGQTVSSRVLLVVRDRPWCVVAVLAWGSARPLGEVLAWLGWPTAREAGEEPVSVRERLRARSNDYWLLEAAMAALGLPETGRDLPVLPGISVVVSARGAHSVLAGTVGSIVKAAERLPGRTPWECVVVDDLSETPLRLPAGLPPQVRLVRAPERVYRGGARNLGQELSSHPVTVFIDDDLQMAPNYLLEHALRHLLWPDLITVSARLEYLEPTAPAPERLPHGKRDADADAFRQLGEASVDAMYRLVRRGDIVASRPVADIGFPPDYVAYGPEDGTFVAKALSQGAFVVPVAETGLFRRGYRRTGDLVAQDAARTDVFVANLARQKRHLEAPADGGWAAAR